MLSIGYKFVIFFLNLDGSSDQFDEVSLDREDLLAAFCHKNTRFVEWISWFDQVLSTSRKGNPPTAINFFQLLKGILNQSESPSCLVAIGYVVTVPIRVMYSLHLTLVSVFYIAHCNVQ